MKTFILAAAAVVLAHPALAQSSHSMAGHGDGHMAASQAGINATGAIDAVDAKAHQVKVTHAPIKALGWPAMTMDFAVAPGVDLSKVKAGDKVEFDLVRGGDGIYMIQRMAKK